MARRDKPTPCAQMLVCDETLHAGKPFTRILACVRCCACAATSPPTLRFQPPSSNSTMHCGHRARMAGLSLFISRHSAAHTRETASTHPACMACINLCVVGIVSLHVPPWQADALTRLGRGAKVLADVVERDGLVASPVLRGGG